MGRVDRRLSETELATGVFSLGAKESVTLEMPSFSVQVEVRLGALVTHAQWDATARAISGEELAGEVALEAHVGQPIRWTRDGQVLVAELLPEAHPAGHDWWPATSSSIFDTDPFQKPGSERQTAHVPPRKRQRRSARIQPTNADYDWKRPRVGLLRDSFRHLEKSMRAEGWDTPAMFDLRLQGERLARINDFDELVAAASARIEPMEHQYAAAAKALGVMGGRAILADEVGLGKTIEAGLIASELRLRGLATRMLFVVPATLRDQWRAELSEKFDIEATIVASRNDPLGEITIISRHAAIRQPRRDELLAIEWDLVVVDEAHKLSGSATVDFASNLIAERRLFLTATPVQNDLTELHRIVDLLRPGTLATLTKFRQTYLDRNDPRRPRHPEELRRLVSSVMIRTTRAQAGLDRVTRHVHDVPIQMSEQEKAAYRLVVQILRNVLNQPGDHLRRDQLVKGLSLSPRGLYESARRVATKQTNPEAQQILRELADVAVESGITGRQRKLLEVASRWLKDPDKGRVIIFTQQTRVLSDLVELLAAEGIRAVAYHGGMSAKAKQKALDEFRSSTRVLVSTEAGAEGLNLQHANAVINYDLPWNPMRIEQRIGRVHRVTQTRDVHVANFFAIGTVDEHVYAILHDKLKMFELLFGQITTILGQMEDSEGSFEQQIKAALYQDSDKRMLQRLKRLADSAGKARAEADSQLADAGGVSAWMSPTMDHRAAIRADSNVLRPRPTRKQHDRQEEIERFARQWLDSIGAAIVHETDGFIAADLPAHFHEAMGTPRLHLAFNPRSLANHPAAELFALGTPLFADVLAATAESGDLLGWVPDVPEDLMDPQVFAPPTASDLTWRSRDVSPAAITGGKAYWLVGEQNSRLGDQLVEASWGDPSVREGAHVPAAGAGVKFLAPTTEVSRLVSHESLRALLRNRREQQEVIASAFHEDRDRRLRYLREQWDETVYQADADRVRDQITRVRNEREPELSFRCELLATQLVGATKVDVTDTWSTQDGTILELRGSYDAETHELRFLDALGEPLTTLGVCSRLHPIEPSALLMCPRCYRSACPACPDAARTRHRCTVCDQDVCTQCAPEQMSCGICGRRCCSACLVNSTCLTCCAMDAITFEEIGLLGPRLGASGLSITRGRDSEFTVLHMVGAHRREYVRLNKHDHLDVWWTASSLDPEQLSDALDIASSADLDGNLRVEETREDVDTAPNLPRSMLLLDHRGGRLKAWIHEGRQVTQPAAASVHPHNPPADLREALEDLLPECAGEAAVVLQHATMQREAITWVDDSGLHKWEAVGRASRQRDSAWQPPTDDDRSAFNRVHGAVVSTQQSAATLDDLTVVIAIENNAIVLVVDASRTSMPTETETPFVHPSSQPPRLGALLDFLVPTDSSVIPHEEGLEFHSRTLESSTTADAHVTLGLDSAPGGETVRRKVTSTGEGFLTGAGLVADLVRHGARGAWKRPIGLDLSGLPRVQISELWFTTTGAAACVQGEWRADTRVVTLHGAYGQPISLLTVCDAIHPSDAADLRTCSRCNRRSCSSCDPAYQVDRHCRRCDRDLCSGCMASEQQCLLCGRSSCRDCQSGPLCRTCEMTDFAGDDVSLAGTPFGPLPQAWCARGLHIAIGADHDFAVFRLSGQQRDELILQRFDGSSEWWSLADTDIELLREVLAHDSIRNSSGNFTVSRHFVGAPPLPPSAATETTLASNEHVTTAWLSGGVRVDAMSTSPNQGPSGIMPERREEILGLLPPAQRPSADRNWIKETRQQRHRLWIDHRGVHAWYADGNHVSTSQSPWSDPSPIDVATAQRYWSLWPAIPRLEAVASTSGATVVIARLGTYRILHARSANGSTVDFDVDGLSVDIDAVVAGLALLGSPDPTVVVDQVRESDVRELDRYHLRARDGIVAPFELEWFSYEPTTKAVHLLQGQPKLTTSNGLQPPLHRLRRLPGESGWNLVNPERVGRLHHSVVLGLRASFVTRNPLADPRRGFYLALPDGIHAAPEQPPLATPVACDEAHVSDAISTCPYCTRWSCSRCTVRVQACVVCGINLCGICSDERGRCSACTNLKRIGWWQLRKARRHGTEIEGGWTGQDEHHLVSLWRTPQELVRETEMSGQSSSDRVPWSQELDGLLHAQ